MQELAPEVFIGLHQVDKRCHVVHDGSVVFATQVVADGFQFVFHGAGQVTEHHAQFHQLSFPAFGNQGERVSEKLWKERFKVFSQLFQGHDGNRVGGVCHLGQHHRFIAELILELLLKLINELPL